MKKPILSLLVLGFLGHDPAAGQFIQTFDQLGYPDASISGISGHLVYYFPLPRHRQTRTAFLDLYLQPSQVLNRTLSYVNFSIDGQSVLGAQFIGDTSHFRIPLSPARLAGDPGFIKLDISTDSHITQDRCQDIDNPALWVRVLGMSDLVLNDAPAPESLISIANSWSVPSTIVYPDQPGATEVSAASWVYSLLRTEKNHRIRILPLSSLPDSIRSFIYVGNLQQLPSGIPGGVPACLPGQGLLMVARRRDSVKGSPDILTIVSGNGSIGLLRAARALLSPGIRNTAFGTSLLVDQAALPDSTRIPAGKYLSFRQMGGTPELIRGIGSIRNNYAFSLGDFAEFPDQLELDIQAKYSPLQTSYSGDRGFFNVYINGVLLASQDLGNSGTIDYSGKIRRFRLKGYNTLTTEFLFYPSHDACMNSLVDFFASVDVDHSALSVTRIFHPVRLSFMQYPQAFSSHAFDVVCSPGLLPDLPGSLGPLLYEMDHNSVQDPVYPTVQVSDRYHMKAGTGLIAFLNNKDSLNRQLQHLPLEPGKGFRIYNNDRGRPLFRVSDSTAPGIAEIFWNHSGQPVLLFTGQGSGDSSRIGDLAALFAGPIPDPNSNVVLSSGTQSRFFQIMEGGQQISYQVALSPLLVFWYQYRLYLLGLVLILLLAGFLFLRRQVRATRKSFDQP